MSKSDVRFTRKTKKEQLEEAIRENRKVKKLRMDDRETSDCRDHFGRTTRRMAEERGQMGPIPLHSGRPPPRRNSIPLMTKG